MQQYISAAWVYLNYTLFAVMITYIFQYETWVQSGLKKVLSHILINGSITALVCLFLVPIGFHFGEKIKTIIARLFDVDLRFIPKGITAITFGLWILSIAVYIW